MAQAYAAAPQPQAFLIKEYGPYGSQERSTFNFVLQKGDVLRKLFIESGDVVDSLGFEIVEKSGNVKTIWSNGKVTGKYTPSDVGALAAHESTVLDLDNERIIQVSGSVGTYAGITHVVQLRVHTDKYPTGYGPFGRKTGTNISDFSSPAPSTGPIVGFFGAQGTYLHSIGVSIEKPLKKYGPYGSQERSTFDFALQKGDLVKRLFIESGDVVDSLGFEVVDKSGKVKTIWSNGSITGKHTPTNAGALAAHESTKIDLDNERITQVSGSVGTYAGITHVVQLRVHTDKYPTGYGPYGRRTGTNITNFASPSGPILGFFGAQGTYLHSIGIYME